MAKTLAKSNRTVIALFIAAFVIRLYHLSAQSLWLDEGGSWMFACQNIRQTLADCFRIEPNPPLYYLFLHLWIAAFGDSEFSLRLPSVLFGSGAVALTYLIGRRHFTERVGLMAAMIASCVPFQLRYSQEARPYTLFSFFALLSIYWMPWDLRWHSRSHRNRWVAAAIVTAYCHFYSAFLLAAEFSFVAWRSWRHRAQSGNVFIGSWLAAAGIVAAAAAPWYLTLAARFQSFHGQFAWIDKAPLPGPFAVIEYYTGLAPLALREWLTLRPPVLGMALIGLLAACWLRRRSQTSQPAWSFLALAISLLVLLPWAISTAFHQYFVLRYAIPASFMFYLMAFAVLEPYLAQPRVYPVAVALSCIACAALTFDYFSHFQRQDWRGAVGAVAARSPGVAVAVLPGPYFVLTGHSRGIIDYYVSRITPATRIVYANTPEEVERLIRDEGAAWLLQYAPRRESNEALERRLGRAFREDFVQRFTLVDLHLYRQPQPRKFPSGSS